MHRVIVKISALNKNCLMRVVQCQTPSGATTINSFFFYHCSIQMKVSLQEEVILPNVTHIFTARGSHNIDDILVSFLPIIFIYLSICYFIHNKYTLLIFCLLCFIKFQNLVCEESITVISRVGIQLTKTHVSGSKTTVVIPVTLCMFFFFEFEISNHQEIQSFFCLVIIKLPTPNI